VLKDRNTLAMVAEHWGCSIGAVEWQWISGRLRGIRVTGRLLFTKEDVISCYAKCIANGKMPGSAPKRRNMKGSEPTKEKFCGLRDRNTVAMVANHWGCSAATVHRLIKNGTLACLYLGGVIRITREQVEACEAKCDTSQQAAQQAAALRQIREDTPSSHPTKLGR